MWQLRYYFALYSLSLLIWKYNECVYGIKTRRIPLASTLYLEPNFFLWYERRDDYRALPSPQVFASFETRQHIRISHYRIKRSMVILIIIIKGSHALYSYVDILRHFYDVSSFSSYIPSYLYIVFGKRKYFYRDNVKSHSIILVME